MPLAKESRYWDEAERLQRIRVDWNRSRADVVIAAASSGGILPPSATEDQDSERRLEATATAFVQRLRTVAAGLDGDARNTVRSLSVSLHELGEIQRELQQPECVAAYEESLTVAEAIDDRAAAAICAFNLGTTLKDVPAIRDLAKAEQWYRRSLELRHEQDRQGRGKCLAQIGAVAIERFRESRDAGEPQAELMRQINEAVQSYQQMIELFPDNAVNELAVAHNQLGMIYRNVGDLDRALSHYRESIRLKEAAGNTYAAATTRYNVALALLQSNRLSDAREYARAALRDFQSYDDRAAEMIARTGQLLAHIEQAIQEQGS